MDRTIFLAGVNYRKLAELADPCAFWLLSVTLIRSKRGVPEWLEPFLKDRSVLYDPGTFSVSREPVSFEMYLDFIDRWVRPGDEYLQYDIVGDAKQSEQYLNKMLQRGFKPIPVYHPGGDKDILKEPKSAIGSLVKRSDEWRKRYLDDLFYSTSVNPDGVHLLGMKKDMWFERYPAISGDSTTWIKRAIVDKTKSVEEAVGEYGVKDIPFTGPETIQSALI